MTKALVDTATIPGWGVDADPANNPTYPMRHVEDQRTRGFTWERPTLQEPRVEILRSIEHNRLPAVLGTATPPSGLSGVIRRAAFRRSENDWWHWLMLMGADRINVVEGVLADLAHGKVPNIPAEMGIKAEWRHNKKGLATKIGVVLGTSAILYAVLQARKGNDATRDAIEPAEAMPADTDTRPAQGTDVMTTARTAILYRMILPEHTCPFGVRAKALLERQGFEVDDRILRSREEVDAFKAEHGVSTTPLVFIDGEQIGGSDELERHFAAA